VCSSDLTQPTEQEQSVIEYLKSHPKFFTDHPGVLTELELTHSSGNAISFIERQVASLREEAQQSQSQLEELIAVARENEQLNSRLHHLTLSLIDSVNFEEVADSLENMLHDDFRAEAVELHLYSAAEMDDESNPDLDGFREFLESRTPRCGRLPRTQLDYLFGPQAADIQSTALIPLRGEGLTGILAIGSHSEHRFHPGMGTNYLTRLGEIVSKTLVVVSEPGS
jgi:uncharacterized protein YigA (DUF484 family)